tara:strand:- start:336 stop:440 length:105 start_codon:yes stop_codon:yes gene_type:complete
MTLVFYIGLVVFTEVEFSPVMLVVAAFFAFMLED